MRGKSAGFWAKVQDNCRITAGCKSSKYAGLRSIPALLQFLTQPFSRTLVFKKIRLKNE
jgi:hypothetical protein